MDKNGNIQCPCVNCLNIYRQTLGVVQDHLLQCGIMQTYTKWYEHREPRVSNNTHYNETLIIHVVLMTWWKSE